MPLDERRLLERWPYCWHITDARNAPALRRSRRLTPAAELRRLAGLPPPTVPRRSTDERGLRAPGLGAVWLCDQNPLRFEYAAWQHGWNAVRLLDELNRRVFFWAGTAEGPNPRHGQAHFRRNRLDRATVELRVPAADLFAENPELAPEFATCNSGALSPRSRRYNLRGDDTFRPASRLEGPPAKVSEITFPGTVRLPASTQLRAGEAAPWEAL